MDKQTSIALQTISKILDYHKNTPTAIVSFNFGDDGLNIMLHHSNEQTDNTERIDTNGRY